MSFMQRHAPQHIHDLVFRDPHVRNTIEDYANGRRDKHLLLHGPAGSGKSIAALLILNARVGSLAGTAVAQPINPRSFTATTFDRLLNDWSMQRSQGASRGYTVIDEVDWFPDGMRHELRAFIDTWDSGTIIVTTNNLHELDEPFKDRFRKLLVERPSAADWTMRAQAILAKEGFALSTQKVQNLLKGFDGSARNLLEWLEDAIIELDNNQKHTQSSCAQLMSCKPQITISGSSPQPKSGASE